MSSIRSFVSDRQETNVGPWFPRSAHSTSLAAVFARVSERLERDSGLTAVNPLVRVRVDDNLDPPIGSSTCRRVIALARMVVALSDREQLLGRQARSSRHQVKHRCGLRRRELMAGRNRSPVQRRVVGVGLDADPLSGKHSQDLGSNRIHRPHRLGLNLSRTGLKQLVRRDDDPNHLAILFHGDPAQVQLRGLQR